MARLFRDLDDFYLSREHLIKFSSMTIKHCVSHVILKKSRIYYVCVDEFVVETNHVKLTLTGSLKNK